MIQDDDEATRSGDEETRAAQARDVDRSPPTAVEPRVYAGRYHVERVLGKGGMGEVFQVRDARTDAPAALKVLNASPDDNDRIERFKREIGVLSKINHAAVPRFLDWGVDRGQVFFVSELVDGHDLRIEIRRRGPFQPADAVALAATVADVLAAAHAAGVVHRDVKPSNIMIARDGSVRLLDFGLARTTGVDTTTLTKTGMIVGTPTYMSPEQFDNTWVDERSDVYSLGVVLFELLTGRPPFSAGTVIGVAMMHKSDLPPSTLSIRDDVPAWLDRIVLKCLEKRPEKRFTSAAALATELRRLRDRKSALRRLPSGDFVVEDDGETGGWALVLQSDAEKTGWKVGMVLRYYDRYYKLLEVIAPEGSDGRWTYQFKHLPQTEAIRTLVDYRDDCAQRQRGDKSSMRSTLRNWMKK
jgi:serine/threonine protein kinase